MKTTEKLANWLAQKNRDYKEGVSIYIALGINVDRVNFYQQKPSKVHRGMLSRELENFARIHKIKPKKYEAAAPSNAAPAKKAGNKSTKSGTKTAKSVTKTQKTVTKTAKSKNERVMVDTNPVVKFDELPADLQELYKQNGRLENEKKTFHTELKAIKDDAEQKERRKELAGMITAAQKTIKANWATIDKWWNSRDEKEEETETAEQKAARKAVEREKRIKSNLNYIRRYQNSTKEKQQKEVEKRKKELDNWGVSYAEVIKKVSGTTGNNKK